MRTADPFGAEGDQPDSGPRQPRELLDLLSVAAVLLDAEGRIVLWSPQAEELFGYTSHEALGQYAARLLVNEQHVDLMIRLFSEVMRTDRMGLRLPCPAQGRQYPAGGVPQHAAAGRPG